MSDGSIGGQSSVEDQDSERKFIASLLNLAAALQKETEQDLEVMLGEEIDIPTNDSLESMVSSAINIVAIHLVMCALDQTNRLVDTSTTLTPLKDEHSLPITFGLFILHFLSGPAEAEGFKYDVQKGFLLLSRNVLYMRKDEEVADAAALGMKLFKALTKMRHTKIESWFDYLQKATRTFCAIPRNDKASQDIENTFGPFLTTLYDSYEG